jgi:transposase InsO family protein
VEPDVRDEVVDFVRKWAMKTQTAMSRLVAWLGIVRSKFHDWTKRYGQVNEHNAWVPRDHWLEDWEKEAIIGFYLDHRDEGHRRLTYMMIDADIVAASASSVYRVLQGAGLLARWNRKETKKGLGFQQPLNPHEHWHTDISYVNIHGTFYHLISVLDGFSRYIVHCEIRTSMTEADVEIVLQRAREKFPEAHPRIISDNGPQFLAKDFRQFIRLSGMTHVRTSPYYPQSNGKQERWHATLKRECIRPQTPLTLEDARRIVGNFVQRYNTVRLHSAIGYVAPLDKLEGRADAILDGREQKLQAARVRRAMMRRSSSESSSEKLLTARRPDAKLPAVGETDASSAGGQLARDSRPGRRAFALGVYRTYSPSRSLAAAKAQRPPMPHKTPGSACLCVARRQGAEPQDLVNAETSDGPESLTCLSCGRRQVGVRHLSISR